MENSSERNGTFFETICSTRPQSVARPRWQVLRLWLYGVVMAAVTCAFAWRYPLANGQTLTDIGKLSQYGGAGFAGYVAGMLLLFACYILALRKAAIFRLVRRCRRSSAARR